MANRLIVGRSSVYRGEYEFDFNEQALSALEWRWIKKLSGYLPMTISDGFAGLDPELIVALSVVVLYRHGRIGKEDALTVAEQFMEIPADGEGLRLMLGEEAEVDDPPEVPAETPATDEPSSTTGGSSSTTSAHPDNLLATTGALS